MNQIKTNNDYKQFLIKNTNMIMKYNCQKIIPHIQYENKKAYPYLFNGINDYNQPYGYETSLPKQMYLEQERINSMKINPLQKNY